MMNRTINIIFFLIVILNLTACGGGGGGNGEGTGNGRDKDNTVPIADAGMDQTMRLGSGDIHLDGSASSDADDNALTYEWIFIEKPIGSLTTISKANAVKSTFTPDKVGKYRIQLTVSDDSTSDGSEVIITIDNNRQPIANGGASQRIIFGTGLVNLDASASSDADKDPLYYKWEIVLAPTGSITSLINTDKVKTNFTPDFIGTYRIQLTVDDGILNHSVMVEIDVAANTKPVADAGDFQEVLRNNFVKLDGRGSSDADGQTLTYEWTQVKNSCPDVTNGTGRLVGVQPTFGTPNEICTLLFDLRVNDGLGNSFANRVSIFIAEGANRLFVDKINGVDSNDGSRLNPFKSIQTALTKAEAAANGSDIYITEGLYTYSRILLKDGVSLYGGYDSTWERDIANNVTHIFIGGSFNVYGSYVRNLTVDGMTLEHGSLTNGSVAALHLSYADRIFISNNIIIAGNAGDGRNGSSGRAGANGVKGENGKPGACNTGLGGSGGISGDRILNPNTYSGVGGNGGREGSYGGTKGQDGSGISRGFGGIGGIGDTVGHPGSNGGHGGDGINGVNGSAALRIGNFLSVGYSHQTGTAGKNGIDGSSGGGGGGGGGQGGAFVNDGSGNGGGGSGSGGKAGVGGQPGTTGYSSFAIYFYDVTNSSINNNVIKAGNAGRGGNGGIGGLGGRGGTGGRGETVCRLEVGSGGNGGNGGNAGNGGQGGGGAGGLSIGIAYNDTDTIDIHDNTYTVGGLSAGGFPNGVRGLSAQRHVFTP